MIKKQSGFSLIEVFVALMLMGILGAAGVEMLNRQNKSQVSTEASFDAIDIAGEIRTVLGSPVSCKKTFQGKPLTSGTTVTQIMRSIKDPATGTYNDSVYLSVNDQRGQRLKIKSLTLIDVDAAKGIGSLEVVAEGLNSEAKQYKKTVPLTILPNKLSPSLIDSCVTVGGPPIDPVELCSMTGGNYNTTTDKCQIQVDLDTGVLPTYCPPGSQMNFEMIGGKPSVKCIGCTPQKVFSHWSCGKPFSGMNWVNMCYYRTVCQNNHSIELYGAQWDNLQGPTSASGGDTGTAKNCRKKRRNCPGE